MNFIEKLKCALFVRMKRLSNYSCIKVDFIISQEFLRKDKNVFLRAPRVFLKLVWIESVENEHREMHR